MVHKITVSSHCRNKNATHRVKSLHSHLHGKEQLTPFQWIQHWFIVIHIKTIGSLSPISKQLVYCHPYQNNWFIVTHIKTSVTQWIHHCFIHDSCMIHTSSNDIPCTTIHLDHTSKEQVSILQFSCYSHFPNLTAARVPPQM